MSKRKHAIEAQFQHGLRLHGAGRLAEAEQIYQQVLTGAPSHADAKHMLGVLALQSGQPRAALALLDQAIALQSGAAIYHVNRANALLALGDKAAAMTSCHAALQRKRNCAEAYQVLGNVLSDLGRADEAVAAYRDALRQGPGLPNLHNDLGLALRQAGQLEAAAGALARAVARTPGDGMAQSNLAGVLKELGRLGEAEQLYRAVLARHPDEAAVHYNLALVLLLAGRDTEGWAEYDWRFRAGAAQVPACTQPLWRGEPLAGRTLLVRSEQGLGSVIQFCRFAPWVSGGPVILEAYPPLRRLLAGLRGVTVVAAGEALPPFDLYSPLMSLPRWLPPPASTPYLMAEPDLVALWRQRLGSDGFRIGVTWQGNPASQAEFGRSCPLACLAPLSRLPGVRLISLQKYNGLDQLAGAPEGLRLEMPELDTGADAFVDTAAVMQSLDLIVTSDTSIAHLAGALGRPVWVALQHVPDWRWQLGREDCPWYPTMRLFRQTRRGDWEGVFARIAERAAALLRHE